MADTCKSCGQGLPKPKEKQYKSKPKWSEDTKSQEKEKMRKEAQMRRTENAVPSSKLSSKQKEIAKKAGNPKKIDSADLAALRKKKKKK